MTQIGVQINANTINFGGETPAQTERAGLRQSIDERLVAALERGTADLDERRTIEDGLERLFCGRRVWTEVDDLRLLSVEADSVEELALPLEWSARAPGSTPVVVRCELSGSATIPERPQRPESTRMVLATTGGPLPDSALQASVLVTSSLGLLDFDEQRDHLQRATMTELADALADASVLLLACCVNAEGLVVSGPGDRPQRLDGATLSQLLLPHAPDLRLIVLMPVQDDMLAGDPGRAIVEVAASLHRAGFAAVLAPRLPLPSAAVPGFARVLLETLLGSSDTPPRSLEHALGRANATLVGHDRLTELRMRLYARAADGDDTRPLVIRPYRGLLSFEREHARFYAGRDAQIDDAIARLDEFVAAGSPRLLLLVGPSGVGKSSLAKAGVVPRLLGRGCRPYLTRPSDDFEFDAFARERGPRLLVVDQLEELLHSTDAPVLTAASEYLQQLWRLANDGEGTIVVATMRIDALETGGDLIVGAEGESTPACSLEKLVQSRHWQYVAHLDSRRLSTVITEPARLVGLSFDDGLVDRLCTDALAQPGALPMLAVVLDRLWAHRNDRTLSATAYEGGLAATLTEHANECIAKLDDPRRVQAKRILVRMAIDPDAKLASWRRRTQVSDLRPLNPEHQAAFDDALAALIERRLVVCGDLARRSEASGAVDLFSGLPETIAPTTIEVAHELLLRCWSELNAWIRADRPRLAAIHRLATWLEEYRTRRTLLTREQLAYVDHTLAPEDDDVSPHMLELLHASRQQLRRQAWLRRGAVGFVVAVALAFAGFSVELERRGDELERRGDELARRGEALQIETQRAQDAAAQAEHRLGQAVELSETIVWDILPELARHPECREEKKLIIDELQTMWTQLGATVTEPEALRETMISHARSGGEALASDNVERALLEFEKAVDIARTLVNTNPSDSGALRDLIVTLQHLSIAHLHAGNLDEARVNAKRVLAMSERRVDADPSDVEARSELALSLSNLGVLEIQAGNLEDARTWLEYALELAEPAAAASPQDLGAQRRLMGALYNLGDLEFRAANWDAARDLYTRELELAETVVELDPSDPESRRDLLVALRNLGELELQRQGPRAARRRYEAARPVAEALAEADPTNITAQLDLAVTLVRTGLIESRAGNSNGARTHAERALAITDDLNERDPGNFNVQIELALMLGTLGEIESQAGRADEARARFERALIIVEPLVAADRGNADISRVELELRMGLISVAEDIDDTAVLEHHVLLAEQRLADIDERGQLVGDTDVQAWRERLGANAAGRGRGAP